MWSAGSHKEWGLSFLRSPIEVLADKESGRVRGIRMETNKLEVIVTLFAIAYHVHAHFSPSSVHISHSYNLCFVLVFTMLFI